jgi:enoyl-CoA hydratase/carnithine racemase
MPIHESSVCLSELGGEYWLTLNRPNVLNAFDEKMLRELLAALKSITDSGRPLIITGAGRAFCTGGDLKAYLGNLDDSEGLRRYFLLLSDVFETIVEYPGVSIAAVNGPAVAGGMELMCACDLAVAGESATFADGHINYGLHPGAGSSVLLPRMIGERRARWLLLSGEFIDAAEAGRIGLVNRVVPDRELKQVASAMAAAVARHSPAALRRTKRLIKTDIKEILRVERESLLEHFQDPATRARLEAFSARSQRKRA